MLPKRLLLVSGLLLTILSSSPVCAKSLSKEAFGSSELRASQASPVTMQEWKKAANRKSCAPLALTGLTDGATARRASFSGGWGVAYDLPGERSAYGIAGTGVNADPFRPGVLPLEISWQDGSKAYYGLEGGRGPGYLAYLRVPGQRCLYNVWSNLGQEHLEGLLLHLRLVQVR